VKNRDAGGITPTFAKSRKGEPGHRQPWPRRNLIAGRDLARDTRKILQTGDKPLTTLGRLLGYGRRPSRSGKALYPVTRRRFDLLLLLTSLRRGYHARLQGSLRRNSGRDGRFPVKSQPKEKCRAAHTGFASCASRLGRRRVAIVIHYDLSNLHKWNLLQISGIVCRVQPNFLAIYSSEGAGFSLKTGL
jgi:hypothetical protein